MTSLKKKALDQQSHALVEWSDNELKIANLERNFISAKPDSQHPLSVGEKITFGPHTLQYFYEDNHFTALNESDNHFQEEVANLKKDLKSDEASRKLKKIIEAFQQEKNRLNNLAYKDELTGLYNRRYFLERMREEISRSLRYSCALSLILMDIDHFKIINDQFGHQKGDEILSIIGSLLNRAKRANDIPFRYGGEELGMVLPEVNQKGAYVVAEKLRQKIHLTLKAASNLDITISLGVAELTPATASIEKIVQQADMALYQAKRQGRNQTLIAQS